MFLLSPSLQVHYLEKVVSQHLGPGHPRHSHHQLLLMRHKAGLLEPADQVRDWGGGDQVRDWGGGRPGEGLGGGETR